jgi:hypothetical protein
MNGFEIEQLIGENKLLRKLVGTGHGKQLYTDDGEMSDCSSLPHIDFKRDPAVDIERKIIDRNTKKFESLSRAEETKVIEDFVNDMSKDESKAFLRRVLGPPTKELDVSSDEYSMVLNFADVNSPVSESNNQHSMEETHIIGGVKYSIVTGINNSAIILRYLPE